MTVSNNVPYVETPLIYSDELSRGAPCKVFLKQEFIQPTGSYKIRGLSHHIKKELDVLRKVSPEKEIVVIAASGGNAGIAVSYASKFYNLKSVIVVPLITSASMRQKIESNGSNVLVRGNSIGEAIEFVKSELIPNMSSNQAAIYCHPYDLPNIWEGHSSLIDEIAVQLAEVSQLKKLKGVVCSIGGGGLYNGLVHGLNRNSLSEVPVVTLETDSCPTFQAAIDANSSVILKSFKSIATSLACPYISSKSLDNYHNHKTKNLLVSDADSAEACVRFASDSNIIVEPACGVALCCVYKDLLNDHRDFFGGFEKDDVIVIIVCGGSATTFNDLANYKQLYNI